MYCDEGKQISEELKRLTNEIEKVRQETAQARKASHASEILAITSLAASAIALIECVIALLH